MQETNRDDLRDDNAGCCLPSRFWKTGMTIEFFALPRCVEIALREPGYWYLATPYSCYRAGITEAFEEACRVSACLIRSGVRVFCPIAMTHPIAIHGGIDPLDHTTWMPQDRPLMDSATGLIVCEMPNWESSKGIREEVNIFHAADKPIMGLAWPVTNLEGNRD